MSLLNFKGVTHASVVPVLSGLLIILHGDVFSQVFGIRRPNIWYLQATPSVSFFLGHTGVDEAAGTTVSDILRWGAGMTLTIGANARRFSMAGNLRMEYQESHASEALPVKGPSIFDLAIRALYSLKSDSTTNFGMAFQGGCYTALMPETGGDGTVTRRFFDPAALYEGVFLSREDQFGRRGQMKSSFQLGYSMQQLVTRGGDDQSGGNVGQTGGGSSQNMGLTGLVALEFLQQTSSAQGQGVGPALSISLGAKGFKKEPGFKSWEKSRVEGALRLGIGFVNIVEFVTAAEVVYDSDISPRRELRTTLSISLKYDAAISGIL